MSKKYLDKNDKQITQQEFLYGKETHIEPIKQEVIDDRVEKLTKHLKELQNENYMDREQMRINKVLDAMEYWNKINA